MKVLYTYIEGDFKICIERLESSKNILWIISINRAEGKENTFYILYVSPGWEVSLLSINICLM